MINIYKNIYIHYSVLFVLLCFILKGTYNMVGLTMISILIHELGHLAALVLLDKKPKKIVVHAFGVAIYSEYLSSGKMVVVAAAGPVISFILAGIFYFLYFPLFIPNMLIGIINLFPMLPLDGGRCIYYYLVKICGRKSSRMTMRILGIVFGVIILIPGITLFLYSGYNITVLMLGVFVFITGISFSYLPPAKFVVEKPCLADLYIIPGDISAGEVAKQLPPGSIGAVINDKGAVIKLVTSNSLYFELAKQNEFN